MRLTTSPAPTFAPPEGGSSERWHEVARVRVELATPMLGGGSEAGRPDEDQPFRPSAIRGALRRWWRAANSFASAEEMKTRERELWGMVGPGGNTAGELLIEIANVQAAAPVIRRDQNDFPAYAGGILIEPTAGQNPVSNEDALRVTRTGSFQLTIRSLNPEKSDEIVRTLSAWLLFGGVGGRTRRGFGALKGTWLVGTPHNLFPGDLFVLETPGFTSLLGARLLTKSSPNALDAWKSAVDALRDFRKGQMQGHDRPGTGPESHSPWPEANAVRDTQGVPLLDDPRGISVGRYPRAEFGLPLRFRSAVDNWKTGHEPVGKFDEMAVPGTDRDTRLASPVIVKPIWWNEAWVAGVLLLTRRPYGESSINPDLSTDATGFPTSLRGYPKFEGSIHQKRSDILDAFAGYLALSMNGFGAVPLA